MKKKDSKKEISDRHKLFCELCLTMNNHTRAYMKVYPNVKENTASVNATRLLKRQDIQDYINEIRKEIYLKNIDEVEKVLTILKNIYMGNTTSKKFFKSKGELIEVEVEPTVSERIKAIQTYATILGYNHTYGGDYHYVQGDKLESGGNEDAW